MYVYKSHGNFFLEKEGSLYRVLKYGVCGRPTRWHESAIKVELTDLPDWAQEVINKHLGTEYKYFADGDNLCYVEYKGRAYSCVSGLECSHERNRKYVAYVDLPPWVQATLEELLVVKYKNGSTLYTVPQVDWWVKDVVTITHKTHGAEYRAGKNHLELVPNETTTPIRAEGERSMFAESTQSFAESTQSFNFGNFGQVNTDAVAFSMMGGLALKFAKNGNVKYRTWDRKKCCLVDVTGMTMPLQGMLFVMPTKKLEVGDIIDHEGDYVFVKQVEDDGSYRLLGPDGEVSEHIKTTNLMGFNFYRKVVTPMKQFGDKSTGIESMLKMNMMMNMFQGGSGGPMQQMLMIQMMAGKKSGLEGLFDFNDLFDLSGDEGKSDS